MLGAKYFKSIVGRCNLTKIIDLGAKYQNLRVQSVFIPILYCESTRKLFDCLAFQQPWFEPKRVCKEKKKKMFLREK